MIMKVTSLGGSPVLQSGLDRCQHQGVPADLGVCLQSTQHAGDDYAKMIQGDPGIEDIYYWGPEGPRVSTRGRTGMPA